MIAIDAALLDKKLLGAALGTPQSWSRWTAVLRAAFALPMSDQDRALFKEVAGDREPPSRRVAELWAITSRRSGKTRIAAAVSVYIAAIEEHRLAPGEVGYVLLLAASKAQAAIALSYVRGYFETSAILRKQIESITNEEVRLKGNIVIAVHTGSFRTIRGRTLLAVVGDETSFWRDEASAEPDLEIFRACAPALAASGGMWIGISSPYRKIGLLYSKWRDHFGLNSDDVLIVQGPSATFNPTLDPAMIARASAADPEAAGAEWEGLWRADLSSFLDDASIDAAVDISRPLELPPRRKDFTYTAFTDASGGRRDAFTLCLAHKEGERFIADVVRAREPPFDPADVVAEYSALIKEYGARSVTGDNYSAEWVVAAFKDHDIEYKRSELNKSALYLETLPLFVRSVVSIPNEPKLIRELRMLERSASRTGRDVVDHPKNGGSDDRSNALVGALQGLAKPPYAYDSTLSWVDDFSNEDANARFERELLQRLYPERRFY